MTDLQKARLEALKKFPETILKVETETVAICDRCEGKVPLAHDCLFMYTVEASITSSDVQRRCPHCLATGDVKHLTKDQSFERYGWNKPALSYHGIDHKVVKITRYITGYQKIGPWYNRKTVPLFVEEYSVVSG